MLTIGPYTIEALNHGFFKLDGGSMFGAVPKNLWSKLIDVDEQNRIPLATRSLLIKDDEKTILIDVGNGDKWSEKLRDIYAIENTPADKLGYSPEEITDIILTHLHFDHAAGLSRLNEEGKLLPTYPNAKIHLQKANYDNALNPSVREQASYLTDHVSILEQSELHLVEGQAEIFPHISVYRIDGHTTGQQYIKIEDEKTTLFFPSDLCPTSRHLPLPYNMGYDICTEKLLEEKESFLSQAIEKDAIIFFQHDPDTPAGKIHKNERGHYALKETVTL